MGLPNTKFKTQYELYATILMNTYQHVLIVHTNDAQKQCRQRTKK